MPKAVRLTPALVEVPQPAPVAATAARATPAPKPEVMPLQVRLSRHEVRAIKVAAAEREQTVSEFMLACFHAYMQRAA